MRSKIEQMTDAIDYIEGNLGNPLDIREIAKVAAQSPWHFQRTFRAITGDSVHRYVTGRRMTLAAEVLCQSERKIIDIALDVQFESQEAFSRAFKNYHGMTPAQFRDTAGASPKSVKKMKINEIYLSQLKKGDLMKPEIKEMKKFHIVGLRENFRGAMADNATNHEVIPSLWKKFHKRLNEIQGRTDNKTYGVVVNNADTSSPDSKDRLHEHLTYYAGVAVAADCTPPEGMSVIEVAPANYACFTHAGPIKNIDNTLNFVFGTWLPQQKFDASECPYLEIFPQDFAPEASDAAMEFCLPIQS